MVNLTGITMDGKLYHVGVRYSTIGRSFRIPEGPNAGEMLSGRYELDSHGTYYDYQMDVEPDPQHVADYDAFFEAISDPNGIHSVVMPYGQSTITLQVKIKSGSDTDRGRLAGVRRWGGLRVVFESIRPIRTPTEETDSIHGWISTSDATATAEDILSGKTAYAKGAKVTGTIASKTASTLTVIGPTVTVPAGYYPSEVSKSVATVRQAAPFVSVDITGKITAIATQSDGYVSAGTKTDTMQLPVQAAQTITPGTAAQTIAAGTYLTGDQTIKGDSNLTAENIKNGISIFGVTGTYVGSGTGLLTIAGVNWTEATLPSDANWSGITYGSGKFVVVAEGSNKAAYSIDGINWTAATLPSSAHWASVTYGNGRFVSVAYGGSKAAYSIDGINWTAATLPSSGNWVSVTYGGGKFVSVAVGSNKAAYSIDGINWTAATLPSSGNWVSVTYGGGKFVATARSGNKAAYSIDGITWAAATLPSSGEWLSITYGGGKFVVVAAGGNKAAYSIDGINWTAATFPSSGNWSSITYGGGKFVVVSTISDKAAYSIDGINWTATTLPSSRNWIRVTYGGGMFVAVTDESASAYSKYSV